MVTVCTVLPPTERPRVDAVGDGCFATLHADSFRDVLRAARTRRVDALVISVHRCRGDELPVVARFVREFPAIPTVALVSRHDGAATEALLRLGATGVRTAVDCTEPGGWRRLRELIAHPASPVAARILGRLVPALEGAPDDARIFFEVLARLAPVLTTVRRLFPFDVSLERYVDLLVTPYREALRAFHPFNAGMWDQGTHAARASWAG